MFVFLRESHRASDVSVGDAIAFKCPRVSLDEYRAFGDCFYESMAIALRKPVMVGTVETSYAIVAVQTLLGATCCRGKAVQLPVAAVRVAVRALGRADSPLPQAHGRQALQVRRVRALLRAQRPPRAAHEAPPAQGEQMTRAQGRRRPGAPPGREPAPAARPARPLRAVRPSSLTWLARHGDLVMSVLSLRGTIPWMKMNVD